MRIVNVFLTEINDKWLVIQDQKVIVPDVAMATCFGTIHRRPIPLI